MKETQKGVSPPDPVSANVYSMLYALGAVPSSHNPRGEAGVTVSVVTKPASPTTMETLTESQTINNNPC